MLWPLPLFHSLSHIACVLAVTAVGATARLMDSPSGDEFLEAAGKPGPPRGGCADHLPLPSGGAAPAPDHPAGPADGLVGGAVAGPGLCRSFREEFGVPLVDAYGSTETCGAIT
ncbi:hypothetical protein Srubr_25420 [Streptomyces rubradiris]|uniref:AMP-dependent synthetase/ligase domain-containing protein n=1 Tax=Streptomyces rubradiris TaxID=285531 RepID=A0ABQ3RA21_STRRR|nr:hypothetical protein Srubr_25420 [Streptomyces rubradiris]